MLNPGRGPALALALTLTLLLVGPASSKGEETKPPPLATQIVAADHARLFIDFLELGDGDGDVKLGPGDRARVIVEVDGKKVWAELLDSTLSVFKLGPVIVPSRAAVTVAVWKQNGADSQFIAKVALRVPGRAATRDFSQGRLVKLTIATLPVDVWAIPELTLVAPFTLDKAERTRLTAALVDFNRRLVDASDGHIRVDGFSVLEPPLPVNISGPPGVITLSRIPATGTCTASAGRPRQPGAMALTLAGRDSGAMAAALLHDFGHAYLGLADEYLGAASGCPDDDGPRCFMNDPRQAEGEACRAADHDANGDTEQSKLHHTDCWSRMSALVAADVGLTMTSPEAFAGPAPPETAAVTFSSNVPVVDMGDLDGHLADAVLNPIIAKSSAGLGACLQAAPERAAQIKFWIRGRDGRVTRVEVNGESSGPLTHCIRKVMLDMRFPPCRAKTTAAQFDIGS